jgi:nucleotide sugar dehydrogenase
MSNAVAVIGQGFVGGSLTTVLSERGQEVFVFDKMGKVAPGGNDILRQDILADIISRKVYHVDVSGVPEVGIREMLLNVREAMQDTSSKIREVPAALDGHNLDNFVTACETRPQFSGIYFICVPTPMHRNGSADLSIVESILRGLSDAPRASDDVERIAVVKSTVPPGSTQEWNKIYGDKLHVIFCPEFLTEANALDDMRNQERIVLGGPRPWINRVKMVFQRAFPKVPIIKTSSTTAEMVKYVTNVHLMVKVSLANEFSQICEALDEKGFDIDYDKVVEYATKDSRLGNSHWRVPGPDGHRGSGGHCFPKDINALIFLARQLDVDPKVMSAAWEKNLEVRTGDARDWEVMRGRAVSDE